MNNIVDLKFKMAIEKLERIEEQRINNELDIAGMAVNKSGQFLANMTNMTKAVSQMNLKYDRFLESPLIGMNDGSYRRFKDADYVNIAVKLEELNFASISLSNLKEATRKVLSDNECDSAVDWANGLRWDGVERVPSLFSTYFGVDPSPYESACSMYFATAMAGRLLEGGCQADMVAVLIGNQGVGKTRSVMALAPIPDTYAEIDLGNTRDSDMGRQLRGKLICELGELKGLKSRDSEWIKSWITRSHEEWIPKYVEYATIMPRRCVFIGTSNEQEFLVDGTGNRRWLPLTVTGECHPEKVKEDCEQIWAEAVEYFKLMGVSWKPAQELALEQHSKHLVKDDAMLTNLMEYFSLHPSRVNHRMSEICQFIGLGSTPSRSEQLRVGDSLRHLSYERKQVREGGIKSRVWSKVGEKGDMGDI